MATSITNTSISTDTINVDNGVLYVDNNNNRVGVGTASPTTTLNVESSSYPYVRITNTGYTGLDIGQADASEGGAALIKLRDSADMDFYTADLNRMRISSTGNVGIGKVTTDPDAKLDVLGDVKIQDGNSFFDSSDEFGYARFTHNYGNAQIGLFRTGNSIGGMYIGGNDSQFAILNQNRAQRWSVTQDGYVQAPYQPAFQAQAVNGDTTYGQQVIPYPGIITNRGNHYSNSTYRFTAPVSGAYCFSWDGWHNSSTEGTGRMFIRKNGSYVVASGYPSGSGIHARLGDTATDDDSQMTAVLELSAGDYVDIYNGDSNVRLFYSSGFSGFLIG